MKQVVALVGALVLGSTAVSAEIKVGAILSLTGPAASLGIPEKNTIDILPTTIAGQSVRYIVLDDTSDPGAAVRAAKKLIEEDKVDVIFGPSITPTSLAIIETAAAGKTPVISAAGSAVIASPVEGPKRWIFKLAAEEPTMASYVYRRIKSDGGKSVAFVGFNDAFGSSFIGAFKKIAAGEGISVVADERYNAKDTSVTAQVLRVLAAKPDAVIVGASGTPGVTPVLELRNQGYSGAIYINQGMANPDVLRVGGANLEGVMLSVSPTLVAEQLPDSNPVKAPALKYVTAYEAKYGAGTRSLFGATIWDAFLIVERAATVATAKSTPGTEQFRSDLLAAMEATKELVGAEGVFNLTPTNHNGTDARAQLLVRIKDGKWTLAPHDGSR